MHLIDTDARHSRRAFLRRAGHLGLAGSAMPWALSLAAMGDAAAQSANDYKALVCVFLYGGNDYANTVVTYDDASHSAYSTIRIPQAQGGIALAKDSALAATRLAPTTALAGGREYALNPSMTAMARLFQAGQAAVMLNVGPLVVPMTRAQYAGGNRTTYPVPRNLFSHNDQQSVWQASSPEGATVGWGGNIADEFLAGNTGATFTCISISGNAVFLSGDNALCYQVGTSGAVAINPARSGGSTFGSRKLNTALAQLVQQPRSHMLENEYNRVTARAIGAADTVNGAIGSAFASGTFPANNSLADQLAMVARLIRGRSTLGVRRQVFFVSLGGFDLHDNLIANHGGLLGKVSDAMAAFQAQMDNLGLGGSVTQFTASDFGRTLSSNGDGSDHGWGSHHFVVGGAVRGKSFYGTPPPVSVGNTSAEADQWHVGQGRLLPTTSVDQYAATLAKWFGVADADQLRILPNLRNFGGSANGIAYPRDLGFMAA